VNKNFTGWDVIADKGFGISTGKYFCNESDLASGIYESICKSLDPKEGDVVCDLACGSGIYHKMISDTGAQIFGIDSSNKQIEEAALRNISGIYIRKSILDDSLVKLLKIIQPNKVILNSFIHYLDDAELSMLITNICKAPSVEKILIGDIPIKEMKEKFEKNRSFFRGIKFFFMRILTNILVGDFLSDLETRNYTIDELEKLAKVKNLNFKWLEQDNRQQFYNTRADLLLSRDF